MTDERPVEISVKVSLRPGEAIRVASGGTFVRLDAQAQGVNHAMVKAIKAAVAAGVITEQEGHRKICDLGQYVTESAIWTRFEYDDAPGNIVSKRAEFILDELRERLAIDQLAEGEAR